MNLRVFLHRNFALGCILIALFGGCIYGLITLLPLFYQEVMLYPAFNAGIAVSPRGLGAVVAMPIIGILTSKMDNRWLIGGGFLIFGICGIWFGEVNLAISPWSFIWAIILSGFGSGHGLRAAFDDHRCRPVQSGDGERYRSVQPAAQCRRQHRHLDHRYAAGSPLATASGQPGAESDAQQSHLPGATEPGDWIADVQRLDPPWRAPAPWAKSTVR